MRAQRIVKDLDIGENIRFSSTAGVIPAQVDQFTFEVAEKVYRHSVVVEVAFAGYALADRITFSFAICGTRYYQSPIER